MSQQRTIICLAAKRSGTTAVHQVFANHPRAGLCHPDQNKANWEPNFWNYAAAALDHKTADHPACRQFARQMAVIAPDLSVTFPLSQTQTFTLWDNLLDRYGPVVFDKSSKYLGSEAGLHLILEYKNQGRDVRLFGLIRHPRDVIASQYARWHTVFPEGTPEYRDRQWVKYYQRFKQLQTILGPENCPLIKYENMAQNPDYWVPFILDHCGLENLSQTYAHIRPVSIGRYWATQNKGLLAWECSPALKALAQEHGYDVESTPKKVVQARLKKQLHRLKKGLKRRGWRRLTPFLKRAVSLAPHRLLETLLLKVIDWRASTLPPAEALRFLFGMDARLYKLHGQYSTAYEGGLHSKHRHMRYHDFFVARIKAGERVLDIGCGMGAVAYDVAAKAGASVVGIDLNPKNIARARREKAHPRIHYLIGDALQAIPAGSFDVVILSNVLEHLPGRSAFLRRVRATANPARFLIRVPLFERDWRVPLKKELGVEWRLDLTHETEYTLESFATEMTVAGLQVTHQEVRWGEIWAELKPDDASS